MISKVLRYTIDKAKRNKFVQNIFEAPFDLARFEKMGAFKDAKGNLFELKSGLRTKIKPGWQHMLTDRKPDISSDYLSRIKSNGEIVVSKIEPLLKTFQKEIEGSDILEIGCHAGVNSFIFAQKGAKKVVGTEFSGYKVESLDENHIEEKKLIEVNEDLKLLRDKLREMFPRSDQAQFVEDDICNSGLEKNAFDFICSWDVLEHLHNPKNAFANMAAILKDDGIMIHEYNSFFSLNGGHSLCTLDFLWGHVRLDEKDFSSYLDRIRPDEKERALSFYKKGLNRMTVNDVNQHCADAGLEIVALLPFTKEQHIRMLDDKIYQQSSANYPNLTPLDLTAPRIILIARKLSKTPSHVYSA